MTEPITYLPSPTSHFLSRIPRVADYRREKQRQSRLAKRARLAADARELQVGPVPQDGSAESAGEKGLP
jgi:hypothetical protein